LVVLVGVQLSVLGLYLPPVPIGGGTVGVAVAVGAGVNCAKDLPPVFKSFG
jgi:hypothetical protein